MAGSTIDAMEKKMPSILTEEMIDAAMSKRLEEEMNLSSKKRLSMDHDYCIDDDDYDDSDFSDSDDYQAVSVIDSDDIENSEDIMIDSNEKQEKGYESDVLALDPIDTTVDNAVKTIELNDNQNQKEAEVIECDKRTSVNKSSHKNNANLSHPYDFNKNSEVYSKKYPRVLLKSLDISMINSDNSELLSQTVNSKVKSVSNSKHCLTIKPITNLLKSDLIVGDENVKDYTPGKIRIFSSPNEEKNDENLLSSKTTSNKGDSYSDAGLNSKNLVGKTCFKTDKEPNILGNLVTDKFNTSENISNEEVISIVEHDIVLPEQNNAPISYGKRKLVACDNSSEMTSYSPDIIDLESPPDESVKECGHSDSATLNGIVNNAIKERIDEAVNACHDHKNYNHININTSAESSPEKDNSSSLSSVRIETLSKNCNLNEKVTNHSNSEVPLLKTVSKSYIQRKQILPKINFRYHAKDKLIVSDKLPKTKVVTLEKKGNDGYILPDGYVGQPLLIMAPNLTAFPKSNNTSNSPSSNSAPLTYIRNLVNANTGEITSSTKAITKPSHYSKTWEKVDNFTLSDELNQQKLEEYSIKSLKTQILEREVPPYKPVGDCKFFSCLDCNDRFVLESSLRSHRFRKSVLIKYWCRTCSCLLNMYNRCMFLAHVRSHCQSMKNLDMTSISIEPLPKSSIKLGFDDESPTEKSQNSLVGSSTSQHVTNTLPTSTAPSENCNQSTTTFVFKKPVSCTVKDLNTISSNGKSINSGSTINKCVKTVPKLLPSYLNIQKNVGKDKKISNEDDDYYNNGSVSDDSNDSEIDAMQIDTDQIISTAVVPSKIHSLASPKENNVTPTLSCDKDTNDVLLNSNSNETGSISVKKSDSQKKGKSKPKRKCPECDMPITAKCSLRKHLLNGNIPDDPNLKCNVCKLILPTNCALKMHIRIHLKLKPFRCPECAIEFHIYDRFLMHLKYTCCHLSKCVRYVCTLCGNVQTSLAVLEQHLLTRHVRSIFKCGNCPVAFLNLKSVEKHKEKAHPGIIVRTHAYQQCRLCPEKLIPKKRFLNHLKGHISDDKLRIYAYQCPTCKNTFFQRTELIYHRMQCDTRDGIIRSVLVHSPPVSPSDETIVEDTSNGIISINEDETEIMIPCKKRKLSNYDDDDEIEEEEKDPLSLEGFQANEEPLREPLIQLCVVCKTEEVIILPGENQLSRSLCCRKCVRPCGTLQTSTKSVNINSENKSKLQAAKLKCYKCKICKSNNSMDLKSTYEHFKTYHKELEGQSINEWLIIENKSQQIKKSNTVTTAETIKGKYMKKNKSGTVNISPSLVKKETNEDSCKDLNEKKKPKRCIKPKQKLLEGKSFERGQLISYEDGKFELNCSKCDFVANNKEELRDHVSFHRTDPTALQCLECGECFVVLPSLEKHLIINHRISDVDSYIEVNRQYIFGTEKTDETEENGSIKKCINSFACKVCHESFDSKNVLDKHFRSHGMAFLFKNLL